VTQSVSFLILNLNSKSRLWENKKSFFGQCLFEYWERELCFTAAAGQSEYLFFTFLSRSFGDTFEGKNMLLELSHTEAKFITFWTISMIVLMKNKIIFFYFLFEKSGCEIKDT